MNLFSLKVLAAIAFSLAQGSAVPVDGLTKRAPKVVGLDFEIHYDTRGNTTIDKRVVSTPLINENQYYITYLLFGSDQQKIGVDIDSGSSDLWIPNTQASGAVTSYGVYDSSTSSSAQDTGKSFTIEYGVPGDSTGSYGEFFTDTIAFSDGSSPIQNFQFGSVYQTSVGQSGILGLGLESLEAPNQDGYGSEYPNFPVALKNAGYIDVVGYSLYLNTPTATGGTLLFGGKDLAKIDGDLVTLPHSGDSARLDVTVDSVTIGGSTTSIGSPYNLDSGTTFTITSPDAFNALVSYVGGDSSSLVQNLFPTAPCDATGTITYNFAGISIDVPIADLIKPNGGECVLLVAQGSDPSEYILGDNFLRYAYVVYNLEDSSIGIGKPTYSTSTNIVSL